MLVWTLYIAVVSGFLGCAALAAEHAQRMLRGVTRWVWTSSIVASLVVPAIVASVSIQLPEIPDLVSPAAAAKIITLREQTSKKLMPSAWLGAGGQYLASQPTLDTVLRRVWWVASCGLLLALVGSGAHLHRRKRHWERGMMAGFPVYFTNNVGPAVVGLLRPRVAVPGWLRQSSVSTQQLVMAHERAHLDAHDVSVFTVSLLLLVCMPWNPSLWWQLRRLRAAIEVDCDARVLRAGHDVTCYGETLIAVSQQQSAYIGAIAGMSESRSFLEERIKLMLSKRSNGWRVSAVALVALALSLVAVAAEVEPPNGSGDHPEFVVEPSDLDRYVGFYKLSELAAFTVTRQENKLFVKLTGQGAAQIYPTGKANFVYKIVKARIDFVADSSGNISSLVLHQNGVDQTAPRVEKAVAEQIDGSLMGRIQAQTPMPGSEAAVQTILAGEASGKPDYDRMSLALATAMRQQLSDVQASLAPLGSVQAVKFLSVGAQGWDTYVVKHDHGVSQVRILVNDEGIIVGAYHTFGP